MGYRKVGAIEQIWYIIKFSILNKLNKKKEGKHK